MPDQTPDPVLSAILYVGGKPETKGYGSDGNTLLKFRAAHTTSYGDGGTTWYDVAIFDEVLIASIGDKLYKGAIVAVEGFVTDKTANDGVTVWHNLRAVKVGLVTWFARRDKNAKPAAAVVAAPSGTTAPTAEQTAAYLAAQGAKPAETGGLPF